MTLGKTLWKLILLKLLIMFVILKTFFFPDVLQTRYDNDAARAAHVLDRLSQHGASAGPTAAHDAAERSSGGSTTKGG